MPQDTWTIGRMLRWCTGYLTRRGDEHPRLSAEWLVSSVTGLSRVEAYMSFDRPMSPDELAAMHVAVERRGKGEPLQYVTGEVPFRHITVRCEPGVLIPRPETEILVDAALEGVDAALAERGLGVAIGPEPPDAPAVRVLDLCTGTGCVACSIASERRHVEAWATDVSPQAAELARSNVKALELAGRVHVLECDLAAGVPAELMGTFSVLVSNPPYIPSAVVPTLPREVVAYEPALALDGGPDGLGLFRRILELAPAALAPGGMLCVELFEESLDAAAALAREQGGWASVEARDDLTHRPRVLAARRAETGDADA